MHERPMVLVLSGSQEEIVIRRRTSGKREEGRLEVRMLGELGGH